MCSYNASLCRLPKQSSEGDDRRHAGTVEKEERGNTLEVQAVFIVTQIEGSFPFDVQDQTTKQPDHTRGKKGDAEVYTTRMLCQVDTLRTLHDNLTFAGIKTAPSMYKSICIG